LFLEWCTMQYLGASPVCVIFARRLVLSNENLATGAGCSLRPPYLTASPNWRIFAGAVMVAVAGEPTASVRRGARGGYTSGRVVTL
jgi:hypothetical protein